MLSRLAFGSLPIDHTGQVIDFLGTTSSRFLPLCNLYLNWTQGSWSHLNDEGDRERLVPARPAEIPILSTSSSPLIAVPDVEPVVLAFERSAMRCASSIRLPFFKSSVTPLPSTCGNLSRYRSSHSGRPGALYDKECRPFGVDPHADPSDPSSPNLM